MTRMAVLTSGGDAAGVDDAGVLALDDLLKRLAADAATLVEVITREQDRERRTRR